MSERCHTDSCDHLREAREALNEIVAAREALGLDEGDDLGHSIDLSDRLDVAYESAKAILHGGRR
jgi:hypothetical protein